MAARQSDARLVLAGVGRLRRSSSVVAVQEDDSRVRALARATARMVGAGEVVELGHLGSGDSHDLLVLVSHVGEEPWAERQLHQALRRAAVAPAHDDLRRGPRRSGRWRASLLATVGRARGGMASRTT